MQSLSSMIIITNIRFDVQSSRTKTIFADKTIKYKVSDHVALHSNPFPDHSGHRL